MQIQFIGSGDAFGSGGRLNTCILVKGRKTCFLIDCGASSLVGLKANQINLNEIKEIFITHFHADHFGGIPFFILDAQFNGKRTEPLILIGPRGLKDWYGRIMETGFPGSSRTPTKFELIFVELPEKTPTLVADHNVTAYPGNHGPSGNPCFSYRINCEGRTIAYSGDTEWTDLLIEAGRDADLLIAEAYFFEKKVRFHLDYQTLSEKLPLIAAKRVVLTHMSSEMLSNSNKVPLEIAKDGLVINLS